MHSPPEKTGIGDPDEVVDTVQDTLDAFGDRVPAGGGETSGTEEKSTAAEGEDGAGARHPRQSSIDRFLEPTRSGREGQGGDRVSRAMEAIALEMRMQAVAMREAAAGIVRDELVITVARECEVPLERLDLVDGYIRDLELEGKLRSVGDMVVQGRKGVDELLSLDLTPDEFMELYRRTFLASEGGGDG